jgi:glycosyltransferase involved in cell wall biosynthesis
MKISENSEKVISIVICTFNRAELLSDVLQTLIEQTIESSCYEVIVVDNNSQDNTRYITEGFCRDYVNIRYCFETRQGLSHARNRGWREANGLYVAYIDDDCKVPTQWLTVARKIIDKRSPSVFGGPYYSYHCTSIPFWWKDSYEEFGLSDTARALIPGELLRGANIFIKRRLLRMIGGFNDEYGMSGDNIDFGEESELQRRIRATMPDELIYYDPDLYIYHLVRPEKMTWRYIICSRFVGGRNIYKVFRDDTTQETGLSQIKLPVLAILTIFKFFASFLVGVLRCDRKRYPYLQNYLYEKTFFHVQKLGFIYERYTH